MSEDEPVKPVTNSNDPVHETERMLPMVYEQLRALAYQLFQGERDDHRMVRPSRAASTPANTGTAGALMQKRPEPPASAPRSLRARR